MLEKAALTLVPLLKLLLVEMGGALQLGELVLGELRLTVWMLTRVQ